MSPRTNEQLAEVRDRSRAKIIQSALELFARYGYSQTSVRMIAESAGISQGLLYNYFASKEELLRAIFLQSVADVRASFAFAGDDPDPQVRLERYIRGCFALLRAHLPFWRLTYTLRGQPAALACLEPEIAAWTDDIRRTLEQHFIARGERQPAIAAAVLFALIDGISQHYALDPDHYPLDAIVDAVIATYYRSAIVSQGSPESEVSDAKGSEGSAGSHD